MPPPNQRRPSFCSWLGPSGVFVCALLVLGSVLVEPALANQTTPNAKQEPSLTFEIVGLKILAVATHLYFFTVGATIGSFLNVVVYRMPRGLGVVYPASRCPRCLTPIRMRDNVPIFSWLRLGGRCRACGEPISSRYLLVELGVGLIFWGLLMAEVVPGGSNLPLRAPAFHRGVIWTVWSLDWGLLGIYAYHCFLMCVLVCAGLIRYDRQPMPSKLLAIGLLGGLLPPLVWPGLRPVPWTLLVEGSARGAGSALADGLAGVAAGLLVGCALAAALRETVARGEMRAVCGAAALVGAFLGWQATVSLGLLAAMLLFLAALLSHVVSTLARIPLSGFVGLATLIQIAAWRSLSDLSWWPGPTGRALPMVAGVAGAATLAWLAGAMMTEPPAIIEAQDLEPVAPLDLTATDAPASGEEAEEIVAALPEDGPGPTPD